MEQLDAELITVIMPCHNAAPYLEAAIGSAMAQSYPHVEIVVVDDASTDGSTEILQRLEAEHPERITLLFQNRMGPYAARNAALARANGAFIAFLDADDAWHPDALSRMHDALQSAPADIAYCGWQDIGTASPSPKIPPPFEAGEAASEFLEHDAWPISSVLIRRQLIDELRGFSERAPSAMDTDLWLRMLARQPRLVRVPQVLAFHRPNTPDPYRIPRWQQVVDVVSVRRDFVQHHPGYVAHLTQAQLKGLIYAPLLREAYRCHWRNDTASARRLFRKAFRMADWKISDLKHLLASLLPGQLYRGLVNFVTRRRSAQYER